MAVEVFGPHWHTLAIVAYSTMIFGCLDRQGWPAFPWMRRVTSQVCCENTELLDMRLGLDRDAEAWGTLIERERDRQTCSGLDNYQNWEVAGTSLKPVLQHPS